MAGLVSPLSNPMHVIKIHMQDDHEISHKMLLHVLVSFTPQKVLEAF